MNISQTAVDGLVQEYSVEIPPEQLKNLLDARILEVSSQARIDGFRPGKVPVSLIRQRYGKDLFGEVAQDQINASIRKIVEDNDLRPAMSPKLDVKTSDQEAGISLSIIFETLPEITSLDLSALEISKPVAEPEDKDVAGELEQLAQRFSDFEDRDKKHKLSDQDVANVKVTTQAHKDGIDVSMLNAEDHMVVMRDDMEPNYAPYLQNKSVGDSVEASITFSDEFAVTELRQKTVDLTLEVLKVSTIKTPELNDELAAKVGLENMDAVKDVVKRNLQGELDRQTHNIVKRRLLDSLSAQLDFDLPPGMVAQEFDAIWAQSEQALAASKERGENPPMVEGMTEDQARSDAQQIAERRLRLALYFSHEGKQTGVTISDDELNRRIYEMCMQSPNPSKMYEMVSSDERTKESIHNQLFEEKVTDSLLSRAKVIDAQMSPTELFAIDPDAESPVSKEKKAPKKATAKKGATQKAAKEATASTDSSDSKTKTKAKKTTAEKTTKSKAKKDPNTGDDK